MSTTSLSTATSALSPTLADKVAALKTLLARIATEFPASTLASSLSIEDMVVTDAILRDRHGIEIFTLHTGRMHGDTLALVDAISSKYGYAVNVYRPQAEAVSQYITVHGRDAFYESVDLRKRCCEVRKVLPLERGLEGFEAWITGRKRFHGGDRLALPVVESAEGRIKFNPLANWDKAALDAYMDRHGLPAHPLVEHGYPSLGCWPCTQPVEKGQDVRAGRWAGSEKTECGIHVARTPGAVNDLGGDI